MAWSFRQIAIGLLLSLVGGFLLWPPGNVYWRAVGKRIGTAPTMGLVLLLAMLLGAGIVAFSPLTPRTLGIGAGLAYGIGMLLIEVLYTPDSPVHLLLYAGFLCCAVFGGMAASTVQGD